MSILQKILIVDDKPENLVVLERQLRVIPRTQVIKANSGNEALIHVLNHKFALAIVDVQMPGMDGFEVCRRIKSDTSFSDTHIIAVTGFATAENREKIIACGAAECLAKPIGPKDIREALERATAKVRS